MPDELWTRWGRDVDPTHVLSEYPRPQLVRESYLNLNGVWEHAFTAAGAETDRPRRWDGPILVPFSPEAPLSGVRRQLQPDELLWYRRTLTLTPGFHPGTHGTGGGRVLLHFGAVDQTCTVWVNDVEVGGHHGGYLPFVLDVTEALAGGRASVATPGATDHTIVVRVRDLSDGRGPSSGKQRLDRGGIWYTAQSGIWQTVWMEAVPRTYVARLDLTPLPDQAAVEVTVHAAASGGRPATSGRPARVRVLADGVEVGAREVMPGRSSRITLAAVRRWTLDDPFLHDVEVVLGEDRVAGYVGMRSLGIGADTGTDTGTGTGADGGSSGRSGGVPRLLLNGEPVLQVGVLDQGYWPDGLMTAPSDAAMVHDIVAMKRLGFTMLRKHIKVEPLRWYHHCDRLGMLVWQDLVNGGARARTAAVTWPGHRAGRVIRLRDDRPLGRALTGRADAADREEFLAELEATVLLLRSSPALVAWVPFNEGWGQFDARAVTERVRDLDPTRVIDHASGWHDQGAGDVRSVHVYGRPFRVPRRGRRGRPRVLALTEYGGHDLAVPGHTLSPRRFGYVHHDSAASLGEAFRRLHVDELAPAVPRGLAATVYTQLSDVEDELNGLLTYDREVLKLPAGLVRSALEALQVGSRRPRGR